ncbi:MAG TPA: S1/P1 nuclease [Burkholderiaceae bacterium]
MTRLLASLILVLLSQAASAWGPLGHRTVGRVAEAMLTPRARAEVARLLADDRGPDRRPSGRTSLAEVSLWADEIRGTDAARPSWHYDNMPACGPVPPERPWCPQQQCATGRIEPLLAQLADRKRPLEERRDALKWITHLVADLHQPLHAVDYAEGGNQVQVEFAGRADPAPWSLHAAWDVRLVLFALRGGHDQQPSEAAVQSLVARARRLDPAQRAAPVSQWLAESNRLARQVALDYPQFACGEAPSQPVLLSADYQRRAKRVIKAQLALAGARLATVLNRALDPP